MKLTFMGATGTVTGSKYLIEDGGKKFLIYYILTGLGSAVVYIIWIHISLGCFRG